ncbi:MAG: hypothetical protein RLZZ175_248 [Bacteroidota bacterium]|jgi:glycine cleavage system H protein
MNFPKELKYTQEHEWIRVEGDVAFVGITDFAQRELGDIVFVDINTVGQELGANDVFGSVEAVKTVSDLFLPVAGTVLEINSILDGSPEKVNSDAYGDGWLIKLKVNNIADIDALLDADAYQKLIGV